MIEPHIFLNDRRKLVYEPGPARLTLKSLKGSEIVAGGDAIAPKQPFEFQDGAPDTGMDFIYSDRDGLRVAVEVKVAKDPQRSLIERGLQQIRRFAQSHEGTIDRAELWTISKGGAELTIWRDDANQTFGLSNIVSTEDRVLFDSKRRKPIDSSYINERAATWKQLVQQLFGQLSDWCTQSNYLVDQNSTTLMDEDLMQRFAVEPIELPVMKIYEGKRALASVLPIGLWVIGANGRIDVLTEKDSATIVNESTDPSAPEWKIYSANISNPLTRQHFLNLIARHERA